MSHHPHSTHAPLLLRVAVLTVSDTRTAATDEGGKLAAELCRAGGFTVEETQFVRDEAAKIAAAVLALQVDAVVLTGGTGISPRDVTIEALEPLFGKKLPGFGELFRSLSFAEIGPAAMLSRATAGTIGGMIVFALPGSPAGVRLALDRLIIPELPHLVSQLRRSHEH